MHFKLLIFLLSSSATAKHLKVPSKYAQGGPYGGYEQVGPYGSSRPTALPGNIPSDSDFNNDASINQFNSGSFGLPFPFIPTPSIGRPVDPATGLPIRPQTRGPIDPSTGGLTDPATGRSIDPVTGFPIDPVTGRPVDPVTGRPIDPATGRPIDPVTGFPIDPVTGRPVDPVTGFTIDPSTGRPVDPATGRPIDPATGRPIDPSNTLPPGTNPNNPEGNSPPSASGGLSQRDTIILAVFGGLFLLILLLLLLAWDYSRRKEAAKEYSKDDIETANVQAGANENISPGASYWFYPFTSKSQKDQKDDAEDLEPENIGYGDSSDQRNFSQRISKWFSSINSLKKNEIFPDLAEIEPASVGEDLKDGSKKSSIGFIPFFYKNTANDTQDSSKENATHNLSKSSKFNLFGKKNTASDEDNVLETKDKPKKPILPLPLFFKSKKHDSDESLHGSKIVEEASKHASQDTPLTPIEYPIEFMQEDFASQSPQNTNMVLNSKGDEVYVLPPMVRRSTIEGNLVEDEVSPTDVIMGTVFSKKQTTESIRKSELQTTINNTNIVESTHDDDQLQSKIITHDDDQLQSNINTHDDDQLQSKISNESEMATITVIEPDSENDFTDSNKSEQMTMAISNTLETNQISEIQESSFENTTGAIVVTETTTVVHHKSLKSYSKRNHEEFDDDDDLDKWAPPAPTSHVVIRTYTPSERDEMNVAVGDLIGIEMTYNDGWAKAQNITQNRKRGMIPLAVITPLKSGPTQTVIKTAGGIWKAGATTEKVNSETISYRETSKYQSESIVQKNTTVEKRVAFDTDKNIMISDDESINST